MHTTSSNISFTKHEQQIIDLIVQQFNLHQLAGILGLSYSKVQQLHKGILAKLNKKTDIGIVVVYAVQHGLVTP